jgi:hypothetical protein
LVEAENLSSFGDSLEWRAQSLTWGGHEFLDTVRNETVWKRLLQRVQERGGTVSFEVMKELAIQISKAYFLEPGGGS